MIKLAFITPQKNTDYLCNTIIDGVLDCISNGLPIEFKIRSGYPSPFNEELKKHEMNQEDLLHYCNNEADLIFLGFRYGELDESYIDKIHNFKKCIFVDGSEYKQDNRLDFKIQYDVLTNNYKGPGKIHEKYYGKVGMYLRREKPYLKGMVQFPFGIERRYTQFATNFLPDNKDIDFVCIFGQDKHPRMRNLAKKILIDFCKKNGFTYKVDFSDGFTYDSKKIAGRSDFYQKLARAKVGISISGGGFDTLRFWETLANNCILLTEKIDIYDIDSKKLLYKRIFEFGSLFDFVYQLEKISTLIKNGTYIQYLDNKEYAHICEEHSTKQRVIEILNRAYKEGITQKTIYEQY